MNQKPLLSVSNLSYGTPEGEALVRNLNFSLNPGETVVISGRNGTGKSTLFRALLGMHPVAKGEVQLHVKDEEIAYLPQIQNKFCHLPFTLLDVIEFSLSRKVKNHEILELNLIDKSHLDLAWNKASGGERQRTMLTRLFLQHPRLLLLDEPTNHLDRNAHKQLTNLIKTYLVSHPNTAFALITHDPDFHHIADAKYLNLDEYRAESRHD